MLGKSQRVFAEISLGSYALSYVLRGVMAGTVFFLSMLRLEWERGPVIGRTHGASRGPQANGSVEAYLRGDGRRARTSRPGQSHDAKHPCHYLTLIPGWTNHSPRFSVCVGVPVNKPGRSVWLWLSRCRCPT